MVKQVVYTSNCTGCWIDGSLGESHRRAKLADMLYDIPGSDSLIKELEANPSDDYSEEDDAIALIQEHTEEGYTWILEAGDLILVKSEDRP